MLFSAAQVHLTGKQVVEKQRLIKMERNTPEENSSDAINWFAVKAVTVALTFPVTAKMYRFVDHLLEDLNQESFSNGNKKCTRG